MKSILRSIARAVWISLSCLLVLLLFPQIMGANTYIVSSSSMEPTLHIGDVVNMKPVAFENLAIGDIIIFESVEGMIVTHRIVKIHAKEKCVETKGDGNIQKDFEVVDEHQILGRYIYKVPYVGRIAL